MRVGAVGVSGLPGEIDEQLALAAIDRTETAGRASAASGASPGWPRPRSRPPRSGRRSRPAHDPRTAANVLALQRAGGNQAVARLLQRQRAASGGPMLQRKWKDIGAIDPESRNGPDFERSLLIAARQTGAPPTKQYEGLAEFFKLGGLTILTPVREFLKAALEDGQDHETNELLSQVISMVTAAMRPPMQQMEEGADDENDHPEEDAVSPEEEVITDPTASIRPSSRTSRSRRGSSSPTSRRPWATASSARTPSAKR